MIRMLHLADLHIGIENYGRIDPTTGLHTRLLDYLARLDEAIAFGLREGVDLVLVAGDIYKNRTPNPTHQREFAKRIGKLLAANVPVFLLTGNHDISNAVGRAHSVEIFQTLGIADVTIASRPLVHRLETRSGPVQIIALPWVTRHGLLSREDTHQASFSEIEHLLRQRIEQFLTHAADELDSAIPAVLTIHGTVDGAQLGAERGITLGQDLVLPRSIVTLPGIDYVALGHIHRHQSLGEHPPIVYAGSIERVDFGERNEDKGCVLVELEKGATRWHFHKLDARPFVSVEVDVRRSNDPHERIAAAIQKHPLSQAVVRLEVQATHEQAGALEESTLRTWLYEAGAFLVATIAIEVERDTRSRFAAAEQEVMQGLTPRRALELYLQAKETSPERLAALLAAADELLAEGEGDA
jgi:DNA repair protein SbcD/Mre11